MASGLATAALLALACAGGPARLEVDPPGDAAPWTHLDVVDAPGDFKFVIVSDRTGGARDGVFESAIGKINLVQPAFVMSVGDLIEGYTEDPARLEAEWAELEGFVAGLEAPFFYAAGNHDYSNDAMAREWARRFGPSYYHFLYEDALFLVLNSELFSSVAKPGEPVDGVDGPEAQLRFVERVLAAHADARWTFVFVHQPFWDTPKPPAEWLRVEALLGERPYTVFAGHFHRYVKHVRHDRRYLTLATTGGTSRMRGPMRGEFDHVALVTMSDAGPRIANLMLDGIHDEDVRTEGARELAERLDEAVEPVPLWLDGDVFRGGEQRFALHNRSDRPIALRARFDASPHFRAWPETLERTLEPGASETVSVRLVADGPVDARALVPSLAHWSAEAEGERGPVRVESTAWLLPDRRFAVRRAARPMRVDAELGEWGPLRFALDDRPESADGPAEASARFDLRHDDAFLYLAADVRDPTPAHSAEHTAFEQDGLVVELDARPDPERSRNEGYLQALGNGSLASLLLLWLAPVEPLADPSVADFVPPPPDGLLRAVQRRDGGYTLELAVPRTFLDERAGGDWRAFRLNLTLQDFDRPGGDERHLEWRPNRFGIRDLAVPGAGTFARE